MNRVLLFACVGAIVLTLVGCGQSQEVSLREEDLAGFKGQPIEKPSQAAKAEGDAPELNPQGTNAETDNPPAPGLAPNPSVRTDSSPTPPDIRTPSAADQSPSPRRSLEPDARRTRRPVDRSEAMDFTIGNGARVVVQGVFKIVKGKVVAWKPDGSPNPTLQKEIGDQFAKIPENMRDRMQPMMEQLEQSLFVVSDVEGSSKPGVVRPDFGGGFGGGGIMSMLMMGSRDRQDGRVVCMAEAPKSGESFAVRFRVSEKEPMTATIPFKSGASVSMGAGKVMLRAINDGPPDSAPAQGSPGVRDGGPNWAPTSHVIFAKTGLPRDPFSIQLVGKDGMTFTLVDKDGKPVMAPTTSPGRPERGNWRDIRPAFRTMGNDGDMLTIGLMVKKDLIASVKLTIVPETIIERTGIAANPK